MNKTNIIAAILGGLFASFLLYANAQATGLHIGKTKIISQAHNAIENAYTILDSGQSTLEKQAYTDLDFALRGVKSLHAKAGQDGELREHLHAGINMAKTALVQAKLAREKKPKMKRHYEKQIKSLKKGKGIGTYTTQY